MSIAINSKVLTFATSKRSAKVIKVDEEFNLVRVTVVTDNTIKISDDLTGVDGVSIAGFAVGDMLYFNKDGVYYGKTFIKDTAKDIASKVTAPKTSGCASIKGKINTKISIDEMAVSNKSTNRGRSLVS